jgi:hypothetical protein
LATTLGLALLSLASSAANADPQFAGPQIDVAPSGGDDTANLQMKLNGGYIVRLSPARKYNITRRLDVTRGGSGIITNGTPATLVMKTTFANPDPTATYDTSTHVDSIGIFVRDVADITLENFKIEKEHVDGSYVAGIWLRTVARAKLEELDLSGFSLGSIVELDSVRDVTIRGCNIHDSWASVADRRWFPQLTALEIDNHRGTPTGGMLAPSTRVVIANNTIRKMRFKRSLVEVRRGEFPRNEGRTDPVGNQTDGISINRSVTAVTIKANIIDMVGEGVDSQGDNIRIEDNRITNTFDYAVKFVHGGSNSVAYHNTLDAAGRATVTIAGGADKSYGNLIRENRITKVGDLSAYCGPGVDPAFRIYDPCPTEPAASAVHVMNGTAPAVPIFNLFFGNTITATQDDLRMSHLFRAEFSSQHSLFYGNVFDNSTGRDIRIQADAVGTIIDPAADRLAVGDVDGDGFDDFFLYWTDSGQNRLYRKRSDRQFTLPWQNLIAPASIKDSPDYLLSGDFDGTRRAALLFYWKSTGTNRFFYWKSPSGFVEVDDPIDTRFINGSPDSTVTGDFDGDGRTDLLFYWKLPGTNRFFYGTGTRRFSPPFADRIDIRGINGSPDSTVTGDFNGDKRTDLLFHWKTTGANRFCFGTAEQGSFMPISADPIPPSKVGNSPQWLLTFDASLDGRDDLDFLWTELNPRQLYLGEATRAFTED